MLQKEHSLTLPHEFHFQYAQVAFSTGLFQTAVDAVKKYLATSGEKGTFYKEALALLNKAEQAKQIIPIYRFSSCPVLLAVGSLFFIFCRGGKGTGDWFLAGSFAISLSASMHAFLG